MKKKLNWKIESFLLQLPRDCNSQERNLYLLSNQKIENSQFSHISFTTGVAFFYGVPVHSSSLLEERIMLFIELIILQITHIILLQLFSWLTLSIIKKQV